MLLECKKYKKMIDEMSAEECVERLRNLIVPSEKSGIVQAKAIELIEKYIDLEESKDELYEEIYDSMPLKYAETAVEILDKFIG